MNKMSLFINTLNIYFPISGLNSFLCIHKSLNASGIVVFQNAKIIFSVQQD